MDKEATELSKAGLKLFSKEMSPEYKRVRDMLLGHLAFHGATTEQLTRKEINDRQNVQMLSEFVKVLPKAVIQTNRWQFLTTDEYVVRIIQSNVVWFREAIGPNGASSHRPYYLLGSSQEGRKWLLSSAGGDDSRKKTRTTTNYGSLFYFEPGRSSRSAPKDLTALASRDYPSPQEMKELFNLERHILIVSGASPGSVKVKGAGIYDHFMSKAPLKRISDEELGMFDVNSHMHRIATALDIVPTLHQILTNHSTE